MANQVFDDTPAYLPWETFIGNDTSMLVTLPFDTATYEFTGKVYNVSGKELFDMTVTKSTTGVSPNFVYKANFAMTDTQIATVPENATYRLKWTQGGVADRVFIQGPLVVGTK
jgi:hypothetical protein